MHPVQRYPPRVPGTAHQRRLQKYERHIYGKSLQLPRSSSHSRSSAGQVRTMHRGKPIYCSLRLHLCGPCRQCCNDHTVWSHASIRCPEVRPLEGRTYPLPRSASPRRVRRPLRG